MGGVNRHWNWFPPKEGGKEECAEALQASMLSTPVTAVAAATFAKREAFLIVVAPASSGVMPAVTVLEFKPVQILSPLGSLCRRR
jgi:hypothetical protein